MGIIGTKQNTKLPYTFSELIHNELHCDLDSRMTHYLQGEILPTNLGIHTIRDITIRGITDKYRVAGRN